MRLAYDPLPVAHAARNNTKQRMRSWLRSRNLIAVPLRRSTPEFATKMLPLVEELPLGFGDRSDRTFGCYDASCVEREAARLGLVGDLWRPEWRRRASCAMYLTLLDIIPP